MKKISNGAKWAIGFFLAAALLIAVIGYSDLTTKGSAPGVFVAAGVSVALALLIYGISRKTDIVPALALLLLLAGTTSCATSPKPAVQQEHPAPKVDVYDTTDAQGNDQQVVAQRAW